MTSPTALPRPHALIVEDGGPLREILVRHLKETLPTIVVHEEESGEKALARVRERAQKDEPPYELVISDVGLAGKLDGLELCRITRGLSPSTAFIIITGATIDDPFENDRSTALPVMFLRKPFSGDDFGEVVEVQLERAMLARFSNWGS